MSPHLDQQSTLGPIEATSPSTSYNNHARDDSFMERLLVAEQNDAVRLART